MDLVAILGNPLNNALTSAKESERKTLLLETSIQNGYHVINIRNSCDTPPVHTGTVLQSTKGSTVLHGFGLKSVARTLKKYSGGFAWEYNETTHEFFMAAMFGEKL